MCNHGSLPFHFKLVSILFEEAVAQGEFISTENH